MRGTILRLAAASPVALATLALAHHGVPTEPDMKGKQLTSKRTLKRLRWVNPHTHFLFDVSEGSGSAEQYTFVGYQTRDGSKVAFLESLTGPDGKTVKIWFGNPNAN